MAALGKALVLAGLGIVAAGLMLMYGGHIPWLGRLPGDLRIEKEGFHLYAPITTCLILSVVLSLVLWAISHFKR